jgi:hypothetical protein
MPISSGDRPILEMVVAVVLGVPFLSELRDMAPPTTRRLQNARR